MVQPGFCLFGNGADFAQVLSLGRPQREGGLKISPTGHYILFQFLLAQRLELYSVLYRVIRIRFMERSRSINQSLRT